MYPLDMTLTAPAIGFAVANNKAEHAALSAVGYGPALAAPVAEQQAQADESDDIEALRAKLDAAGVDYDKRLGAAKLRALLAGD